MPSRKPPRKALPRLLLTPGEPAGVGPDLAVGLSRRALAAELVVIADPELLRERARRLKVRLELDTFDPAAKRRAHRRGRLLVCPVPLRVPSVAGRLAPANAEYVLATLRRAVELCQADRNTAMVTGPVHKGVINDAGIRFSGHTEYLAELTGVATPVMLLVAGSLRVALATTHLALRDVPAAITAHRLKAVLRVLARDLVRRFGIARPRILVAGLNPHAGEQGHLGREEIDVIEPALAELRAEGLRLTGPLPADTLFTQRHLRQADAVLAMYHDQGLPVLKYAGFGEAVNVTLGLPIARTSVDHGTALELAGHGRADPGSLHAALALAVGLARRG
ncbi:MAG TPA: 4-hydroxythreonine-4-phosphate dehydrogenase PdxA [Verrucomicrobiae bacterium]|nr:4-hydroxythreonine-4-phosphate dehydrogenase PdxA [Verrucomicrobiae bacterium]